MAIINEDKGDAAAGPETSYSIVLGDTFLGTFSSAADEDWIEIDLQEGEEYAVGASGGSESDWLLDFWINDREGEPLSSDDFTVIDSTVTEDGLGWRKFTAKYSGIYYIEISRVFGTDSYRIVIEDPIVIEGTSPIVGTDDGDTLIGDDSGNEIYGKGGNDILEGGAGHDMLDGGAGDDTLNGGPGSDDLIGGEGEDTVSYISSNAGVWVDLTAADIMTEGGDADDDHISMVENLIGSEHDDILEGDDEANKLWGRAGNDQLIGGAGDDTLDGGADNDSLFGDKGADTLTGGAGADMLEGGEGEDTVSYSGSKGAVLVDLSFDIYSSEDYFHGLLHYIDISFEEYSNSSDAYGDQLHTVENVIGSEQGDLLGGDGEANKLWGRAGNDELFGGAGDDTLDGGAGNDKLFGGLGADTLIGGEGEDTAYYRTIGYDYGGPGVVVRLHTEKTDDVIRSDNDAEGDTFSSVENLSGSEYDDILEGDDEANKLWGRAGNDELIGGVGDDTLIGGDSDIEAISSFHNHYFFGGDDDTLIGGAGADTLDGGIMGTDTISYASYENPNKDNEDEARKSNKGVVIALKDDESYSIGQGGDAEGDKIKDVENIIGSKSDDMLTGNKYANTLAGGAGADTLAGGAGADTLEGGDGDDTLEGGDGDDILIGGVGGDTLIGGAGSDTVSYAGSDKPVAVLLSYGHLVQQGHAQGDTLSDIENLTGSEHNDLLLGDRNANRLTGGDGDDALNGYGGDDELEGGAGADDLEGGIGGSDTVSYATSDAGVTVDLQAQSTSGGHAQGDSISGFENVTGSGHADALIGSDSANRLKGGYGDDTLTGGAGEDIFVFFGYYFDYSGKNTITDFADGEDRIELDVFGIEDFDDLQEKITQDGNNTLITFDADNVITLENVDMAIIGAEDFIFVA